MIITYIAWVVLVYAYYKLHSEYEALPDQVPIKYDLDGSVQNEAPKSTLYILVGVGFMIAILMTSLMFMEGVEEASLVLEATHLLTQLLFAYIIYQTIKVVKGEAEGLGKEFYILMIAVIVLPLVLVFLGQ